jgi:tetratricopeptide (TPR) repeat protein
MPPFPQRATLMAGLQQSPADPVLLHAFSQRCEADAAWQELHQVLDSCLPHLPVGSELEAMARYYNGKACVELGQHATALPQLERSIALQPAFPYSHQLLGRCLRSLDRRDQALEAFRRTTQLLPGFFWAWFELGELLLEQQEPEPAIEALQQALQACDSSAESEQALIRDALGRAEQAAQAQRLERLQQRVFPGISHLSPLQELQLSLAMLEELASHSAA